MVTERPSSKKVGILPQGISEDSISGVDGEDLPTGGDR